MKTTLLSIAFAYIFSPLLWAQTGFMKTYGYDSSNYYASHIIETMDGGFLMTGVDFIYTTGPMPYELLYDGSLVVRTDSNGDTIWTRYFNETLYGMLWKVFEMPDSSIVFLGNKNDNYLCGGFGVWFPPYMDYVYLKLDKDGNFVDFNQFILDCEDHLIDGIKTKDGGFAILGMHRESGPWGTNTNPVINKLSSSGNLQWTKNYSDEYYEVNSLIQDDDENYFFTGLKYNGTDYDAILVKTDLNGDTIFTEIIPDTSQQLGKNIIATDTSGNLLILAREGTTSWNYPHRTAFYKVNSTGGVIWTKKYQFTGYESKLLPDGGFLVLGTEINQSPYDSLNAFVVRLNENGDSLWSRNYGWIRRDLAASICLTNDGGYGILGTKDAFNVAGSPSRYFVAKDTLMITNIEEIQWSRFTILIYPNPFQSKSSLEFKTSYAPQKPTLKFYDVLGREITNMFMTDRRNLESKMILDITNIKNYQGLVFFEIYDKEKLIGSGKFVTQ